MLLGQLIERREIALEGIISQGKYRESHYAMRGLKSSPIAMPICRKVYLLPTTHVRLKVGLYRV